MTPSHNFIDYTLSHYQILSFHYERQAKNVAVQIFDVTFNKLFLLQGVSYKCNPHFSHFYLLKMKTIFISFLLVCVGGCSKTKCKVQVFVKHCG